MRHKFSDAKTRKKAGRRVRVRRRIEGSPHPRLVVNRTARHIYAQLVDAESGRTLTTVSTRSKALAGAVSTQGKLEAAKAVGQALAQAALEKSIERVVFNRNGFLYHGRVKALADAAREAGLRF